MDYSEILNLQETLEQILSQAKEMANYDQILLKVYRAVNLMLKIWLEMQEDEQEDFVNLNDDRVIRFVQGMGIIPIEIEDACKTIEDAYEKISTLNDKTMINVADSFDRIENWFFYPLTHFDNSAVKDTFSRVNSRAFSLSDYLKFDKYGSSDSKNRYNYSSENEQNVSEQSMQYGLSPQDLQLLDPVYKTFAEIIDRYMGSFKEQLNRIEEEQINISKKMDVLSNQISGLSMDIKEAQGQVSNQLKIVTDPTERESILAEFTDQCIEKVMAVEESNHASDQYSLEENKLKYSLGNGAWNKIEEKTKTFLTTAKVMFNQLIMMEDIVDYSGVCLLVTKGMETELKKRFYYKFLDFLQNKYGDDYNKYPTTLLNRYKNRPLNPSKFTLGNVPYVMCYFEDNNLTEQERENNRYQLMDYCRSNLFSGKSEGEIRTLLKEYSSKIEQVKDDYRNPSAHTNEIQRVNAEECFNLVLDVERILKVMLDSFNY